MEPDSLAHAFGLTFQVSFLDLILSGDNALVIALACRALPEQLRRQAILWGTGFAILLRLLLTAFTGVLMMVPLLKLTGAVILLFIAFRLLLDDAGGEDGGALAEKASHSDQLWNAVTLIVGADLALSLDNVVALAAAAQGSVLFLLLGLLLSVPLLMYGSLLLSRLMNSYPLLIPAGAAALGWLAGSLAVGDALWADWLAANAPALQVVVPLLTMAFVLLESRVIREQRRALPAMPPLDWFAPLTRRLAGWGEARIQTASAPVDSSPAPIEIAASSAAPSSVDLPPSLPEEAIEPAAAIAPQPQQDSDEEDRSGRNRLSPPLKLLVTAAAIFGAIVLLWLIWHLTSQGFLPAPAHHAKSVH
ncbi:YjbE family putative metal transport protein [Chromobacterium sp. IIBBL 290-4]|uniref:YjbE family putative metal transport protein n=1 Tax=Chromobacterium sp. IIBBL 290-4 TaxID=2953890 RepID=UPI0020B7E054|nr:YjbE family putative metal transport protein [Chromobacterium sp. IIBBL 290-4]UTH74611.1 YjbE family putative metal transport protein [Chromobacterium sp. IIBBL 290-4]